MALGGEEGEAHAAADEQPVDLLQQVPDDAELVGHLRPAEHHDVGPVAGRAAPCRTRSASARTRPPAACGSSRATSYTLACLRCTTPKPSLTYRSARAASRAAEGRPLGVVLAGLGGLEAQVLQQRHVAVAQRGDGRLRRRARRRRSANATGRPSSSPAGRRPARSESGRASPLGRPRCAHHDHPRPAVGSARMVGHAGPDAAVVGDRPGAVRTVGERHVQVRPDQHPPPGDVEVVGAAHGAQPARGGRADVADEVDQPVGVAPLVVVPAEDLRAVADDVGQDGVEDARRRVGHDVGGDDRVLGVLQEPFSGPSAAALNAALISSLVAGLDSSHGQVGGRAGRHRHAQRDSRPACP